MKNDNKVTKVLKRYSRVKNYVKKSINNQETNLDTYVQQLIQASKLRNELITELIKA